MLSAQDYYSFCSTLPGRTSSKGELCGYRFGFNGQEKETELNPSITSAEYWMYDGRLGRRWNIDPIIKPLISPFSVFTNNPISRVDPNGDDDYYNKQGKFIGSIGENNGIMRVVSGEEIYNSAKANNIQTGKVIFVDHRSIQSALSTVGANTQHNGKEYVALITFDPEKAIISADVYYEGSNYSERESRFPDKIKYDSDPKNGGKLLIGVFHGHPEFHNSKIEINGDVITTKTEDVVSGVSIKDYRKAKEQKISIYAVDAFSIQDIAWEDGTGAVHKAYPDGSFKNFITTFSKVMKNSFNIGKDALETTGGKPSAQIK